MYEIAVPLFTYAYIFEGLSAYSGCTCS